MNCLRTVVCGESLGPRSVVGSVTEGAPGAARSFLGAYGHVVTMTFGSRVPMREARTCRESPPPARRFV